MEVSHTLIPAGKGMAGNWDVTSIFAQNLPSRWGASRYTSGFKGQLIVNWMTGGKAQELLELPVAPRQGLVLIPCRSLPGITG